jgi:hypothetical protein
MDKVANYAFEWWNWGVHRLISLSEEYQIGEHAVHYKYAVWILILLCILVVVLCLAFLTLSAMGILPVYSWWISWVCFRWASLMIAPWFIYEQFYDPEPGLTYFSRNLLYGIAFVWILGAISMCLYIISRSIEITIGCCCPLPTKDHIE